MMGFCDGEGIGFLCVLDGAEKMRLPRPEASGLAMIALMG